MPLFYWEKVPFDKRAVYLAKEMGILGRMRNFCVEYIYTAQNVRQSRQGCLEG
jgi:hypothetical protein